MRSWLIARLRDFAGRCLSGCAQKARGSGGTEGKKASCYKDKSLPILDCECSCFLSPSANSNPQLAADLQARLILTTSSTIDDTTIEGFLAGKHGMIFHMILATESPRIADWCHAQYKRCNWPSALWAKAVASVKAVPNLRALAPSNKTRPIVDALLLPALTAPESRQSHTS